MKGTLLHINVLMMLVVFSKGAFGTGRNCPRGFYYSPKKNADSFVPDCAHCSTCRVGQGVKRSCSRRADTVCEPCVPGESYSTGWGNYKYCRTCKQCGPYRDVVKPCSLHRNTECGECKIGSYWNPILEVCEPCSYCLPELYEPRERYVARQCRHRDIPAAYQCAVLAVSEEQPSWFSTLQEKHESEDESSGDFGSGEGDEDEASGNNESPFVSDDEDLSPQRRRKPKVTKTAVTATRATTQSISLAQSTTLRTRAVDHAVTQSDPASAELTTRSDDTLSPGVSEKMVSRLGAVATSNDDAPTSGDLGLIVALAATGAVCCVLAVALALVGAKYMRITRTNGQQRLTNVSEATLEDNGLLDDVSVENN